MIEARYYLYLSLTGLAILIIIFLISPYNSTYILSNLSDNDKVKISGVVIGQSVYQTDTYLHLDNNITVIAKGVTQPLRNKLITVYGIVEYYNGPRVKALKITYSD